MTMMVLYRERMICEPFRLLITLRLNLILELLLN